MYIVIERTVFATDEAGEVATTTLVIVTSTIRRHGQRRGRQAGQQYADCEYLACKGGYGALTGRPRSRTSRSIVRICGS